MPTNHSLKLQGKDLPKSEMNTFSLIQNKLLAAVNLDYIYEEVKVTANVEGETFTATSKVLVEPGHKKVEDDFKRSMGMKVNEPLESNTQLIKLSESDIYLIQDIEMVEGMTSPPKYFTEDTLLSAMERAGKEELDESLETEKQGLGTPATRAGIIEKLISVGYVDRKKRKLLATDKGNGLIKIAPEKLKSATVTAQWENKLTEIANSERNAEDFLSEIQNEVIDIVKDYGENVDQSLFRQEKEVIGICPRCGQSVYESKKNFYCSCDSCKFSMWKEDRFFTNKKKVLTKIIAKSLLKNGKVKVSKLYSEKKSKTYDAVVVLDDTGTWVNYKLEF